MKKTIGVYIKNVVFIFAVSTFAGFLLIILSQLLPKDVMKKNVVDSIYAIQGNSASVLPEEDSMVYNKFSDTGMLLRAIYDDDELTLLEQSVLVPYARNSSGEDSPPEALIEYLSGKELSTENHDRYWDGYLIVLRPLLFFFNYNTVRIILFCVELLLIIAVAIGIVKRKLRWHYYLAFLALMVFMSPLGIFLSIHYAAAFCIAMIATVVILRWHDTFVKKNLYPHVFMIIGICTCYFDLLSYPLITWGIPAVFLLILDRESKFKDISVKRLIIPGLSWLIGYVGFWAAKWVMGSLLIGQNLLKVAFKTIGYRTSSIVGGSTQSYWDVISKNLSVYSSRAYWFIAFIIILILVVVLIRRGRRDRFTLSGTVPFIIIAAAPFFWYFALKNHSYIHSWMTFRILSITAFALLAMVAGFIDTDKLPKDIVQRKKNVLAIIIPVLLTAAFFACLISSEDSQTDVRLPQWETTNILTSGKWAVVDHTGDSITIHPGDAPTAFDIELSEECEKMSFTAHSAYSFMEAQSNGFSEKQAEVHLSVYLNGELYNTYYVTWKESKTVEIFLNGASTVHIECDEGKFGLISDTIIMDTITFE